ncbi:MAG: NADPH-dependent stearoyl-CoA 9-desaturase [Solirubrobacteraceae bacterium]|nr:NADPH-dependent stearoyl-CoA 9-desaturase [Solirubrobacteraceae bacterium]
MATAMAGSKAGEKIKSGIPTIDESLIENPIARFSAEEIEQIGKEFEALHDEVFDDLGERDAKYIRSIIELQRRMALIARILLVGSKYKPLWISGTALLSTAKILENMEIGHNVLHGQWDWMNDPVINSQCWDWDNVSPASGWKFSHNYVHHTFTNIRGKDRDLGYEIMRIDPHQKWHPVFLLQPFYNLLLMAFFEWGVATHDLDLSAIRKGEEPILPVKERLKAIGKKAAGQLIKDYVAFPALSGKHWKKTAAANFTANIVRNVWSYSIIFCGHFPDQTYSFSEEETAEETKGGWYMRQLLGAANIDGGPFFHVMSGNLGYQVEHHLYPDMPSTRYGEIAPKVREICEKWGLPYNTGPLHRQLGSVHRTIIRLAFPGGKPRPKPGPYRGDVKRGSGERETRTDGSANGTGRS